ncbi:hypothetical protein R1flu_013961 [Riccia fluitans]|uniref:Uncharacterized protein n=1 Tax=Riccia fluitans TaxID=41844 RepID=A0ABD1YFG5_9MARC
MAAETSAKAPDEEDELVPDENDPNTKVEPELRRSKQRRSSPLTLTDKPRVKKKMKITKMGLIDLSDEEPQEAKQEEETVFAKGTSQALETDNIENFKRSITFDEVVVVTILRILDKSRAQVEEEVGKRMFLAGHLSKENWIEEKQKLRMEAQKKLCKPKAMQME